MRYNRFEELPVWQAAIKLGVETYTLTSDAAFRGRHSLRDQIERASVSVSNNVAEGFERGTNNELLTFLYIARGSAGEVRNGLLLAAKLADRRILKSEISNLKSQISNLLPTCESVSRQLRGWADSLQNTDIRGQRHLNDASRAAYTRDQRTREFLEKLNRIRAGEKVDWGPDPDAKPGA